VSVEEFEEAEVAFEGLEDWEEKEALRLEIARAVSK
jgi:hypothetical protein